MAMISVVIGSMTGMTRREIKMAAAEEFVCLMEVAIFHTQHIGPTTQFLQDCIDFWRHTQMVIQDQWE